MLPWSFWQVACTASVPPGRLATFSRAPATQYNSYEQILLDDGCLTEFVKLIFGLRMQVSVLLA